jgi:formylmethanofuran dehydrogenase subunit C
MDYLCETNWKNVRIFGGVGDNFAHNSRGSITVFGSVGNNAASEFGSSPITLPNFPAILDIRGDAGANLGSCMCGGEIRVSGKIKSLASFITGGNIFQNGVQLVKDGKVIAQPISR